MTTADAALVLAWLILAATSLGLAALFNQVKFLTAELDRRPQVGAGPDAPSHSYRLPASSRVAEFAAATNTLTVALFVSPSCAGCHRLLASLSAASTSGEGANLLRSISPVVVIAGPDYPTVVDGLGAAVLTDAIDEHSLLAIPATPWLMLVDPESTLVFSGLVSELEQFVRQVNRALSERQASSASPAE